MYLYSAFFVVPHTQGAQTWITQCYLQITPYLPLPRKHSPDGAYRNRGCGYLIAAYYSFIYPKRMKGSVGLVGRPTADSLPTLAVTHQPQVERRTAKVRLSETDVLPLCHATNDQGTPLITYHATLAAFLYLSIKTSVSVHQITSQEFGIFGGPVPLTPFLVM